VTVGDSDDPGERALLARLFQNLIGNAIKFRRTGQSEFQSRRSRRTIPGYSRDRQRHRIGEEYLERIFLIFQRLHERNKYPGTGIGLAIARRWSSSTADASGSNRHRAGSTSISTAAARPRSREDNHE